MKNLFKSFLRFSSLFYKTLLFAITISVVVYFVPKKASFKYEFQEGKPWLHEDLYSPFDFPIYKSQSELELEKDSLGSIRIKYYRHNNEVLGEVLQIAEKNIDRTPLLTSQDEIKSNLKEILNNAYNKGILPNGNISLNNKSRLSIVVITDNIAEEYEPDELLYVETAISFFREKFTFELLNSFDSLSVINDIIPNLNIQELARTNLVFDEDITLLKESSLLDDISLSYGMIDKGEVIITNGSLVSSEKFKILKSLKLEFENRTGTTANMFIIILGQALLVIAAFLVLFLFLYNFRKDILRNNNKTVFILLLILIFVALTGFITRFGNVNIYFIPFALLPIIIKTFYDARLAIFIHIVTTLLIAFIVPNSYEFVFLQFIAGIVAVFALQQVNKRSQIFWTSMIVFLAYSVVYFAFSILHEGSILNIEWRDFIWFGGNAILLLTSYPLIYIFEKLFGFLSDLTLIELADTNNPLLRKLSDEAPGTFQHSLQVSNLATEAIYKIGGNPLLIRVGALYHDIGKMGMAPYFIENQIPGINPHDDISFEDSADIIIGHVAEGIKIAKKYKLPEQIIDFISTHHGTTRVQYFYKSFLKKYPTEEADISRFSYNGPIPHSKETAVLMMADSVEAASRSLKVYSEKSISELVEGIISYQRKEGQFDDADITFKDITSIIEIFNEKLKNIYHSRIEYPK